MIVPAPRLAPTEATRRWAALLQQIFEVDPLTCPTCDGPMRVVAFITQASVIDQILAHLQTRRTRPRRRPLAAARAPGDHALYSTHPDRNSYPAPQQNVAVPDTVVTVSSRPALSLAPVGRSRTSSVAKKKATRSTPSSPRIASRRSDSVTYL